jgi:hypothetical protein
VVENSACLCLCYIMHPGNCAYVGTWASQHCCHNIALSRPSVFTVCIHPQEGTNQSVWNVFRRGILRSGHLCRYFTTAALPLPLQKLYTGWISTWVCSPVSLLGSVTTRPYCNTTQPLASSVYNRELDQLATVPAC